MTKPKPEETTERRWLTYAKAGQYAGLSQSTLLRGVQSGQLKCSSSGRGTRFTREQLDAFMERRQRPAPTKREPRPRTKAAKKKTSKTE